MKHSDTDLSIYKLSLCMSLCPLIPYSFSEHLHKVLVSVEDREVSAVNKPEVTGRNILTERI